jgi:class 3 adenylate cyclase
MSIRKAVLCAMDMLIVVDQGIKEVLKDFDFPDLHIRIRIDSVEIAVIEYGSTETRSHTDILGYPMNVTAKIETLTPPDHNLIGNATYNGLNAQIKK